jgi:hypothetical protein
MKLPKIPEFSKETFEEAGKLLHDDQIANLVNKYNERYLHWEELKYREFPVDPAIIWNLMKMSRILKAKSFKFGNWVFKYNLIDEFQEKLHILEAVLKFKSILQLDNKTFYANFKDITLSYRPVSLIHKIKFNRHYDLICFIGSKRFNATIF